MRGREGVVWVEAADANEGGEKMKGNLVLASGKEILRKKWQSSKNMGLIY